MGGGSPHWLRPGGGGIRFRSENTTAIFRSGRLVFRSETPPKKPKKIKISGFQHFRFFSVVFRTENTTENWDRNPPWHFSVFRLVFRFRFRFRFRTETPLGTCSGFGPQIYFFNQGENCTGGLAHKNSSHTKLFADTREF